MRVHWEVGKNRQARGTARPPHPLSEQPHDPTCIIEGGGLVHVVGDVDAEVTARLVVGLLVWHPADAGDRGDRRPGERQEREHLLRDRSVAVR
jgi:hypothetical protein